MFGMFGILVVCCFIKYENVYKSFLLYVVIEEHIKIISERCVSVSTRWFDSVKNISSFILNRRSSSFYIALNHFIPKKA
jgi:hypothetical protein